MCNKFGLFDLPSEKCTATFEVDKNNLSHILASGGFLTSAEKAQADGLEPNVQGAVIHLTEHEAEQLCQLSFLASNK